jgi:hypothetical protein
VVYRAGRGLGGFTSPPPPRRNSEVLTKLSRIPSSVEYTSVTALSEYGFHSFANWVEPLTRGLPPPNPHSLCPLSSTEFVDTPPPTPWKKIPGYATEGVSIYIVSCEGHALSHLRWVSVIAIVFGLTVTLMFLLFSCQTSAVWGGKSHSVCVWQRATLRLPYSSTTFCILPYFPVDNAHLMYNAQPVFSVLTNFLNRYRAPENTCNRTTGCGQARI